MARVAYIIRGIPGSGKSSWLREQMDYPNWPKYGLVASADYGHMTHDGYKFDPRNIKKAHADCLIRFFTLCDIHRQAEDVKIAVDNTNVKVWELAPYVRIAESYGFDVKIIRMVCDPIKAHLRNTHGVPIETVWRMHNEMENLPAIWTETPVLSVFDN